MGAHTEEIIKDVRDGTLSSNFDITPEIRRVVEPLLAPDPRRATELEAAAYRGGGRLLPRTVWPDVDYDMAVEPGDISNLMRFIAAGPSYLSCVADVDTKVLVWKAPEAIEFWDRYPEVGYRVVTAIAKLLHSQVQQLNQVILDRVSWGLE